MSDDLALGRLLGRREAFNLVAARCSAADASILRDIRERKLYLGHADGWEEFCTKFLHTTKDTANRVIRYLEEFGPTYFEVAQLTPVSPATYRAIAPAIQDHALRHNGETITLVPENAEKVVAAVAEMRKQIKKPAPAAAPPVDEIAAIDGRCAALVADLTRLVEERKDMLRLQASVGYLQSHINRIAMTL